MQITLVLERLSMKFAKFQRMAKRPLLLSAVRRLYAEINGSVLVVNV